MGLKSCSLFGRCRDRNTGKLTKISLLHRDLVGLGKISKAFTRLKANRAFYLSQDPKFLDRYLEDLVFTSEDADAEPKLASFFEAASRIMPEVKLNDIRELLAKKFNEGVYSYEDALQKVTNFNQGIEGGNSFIGTLVPQPDGRYLFKIVYNSVLEQEALMQAIADRKNAEAILQQLDNLNVGVVEGARSLYNTKGPKVVTKGILGIITLKGGERGAAYNIKDLASETGHLIVGMLGEDDKFVKRLTALVEQHPEVVKELLGEEEFTSYFGTENATREFVGHIVGKYLELWENIKPLGTLKTLGNLIQRMIDWISSKLHFSNRDYYLAMYEAKWSAYSMVKSFMGHNFLGSLENALNSREILRGDINNVYAHLNTSIQKLKELLEESKDYGYRVHKNYRDEFNLLMSDFHELGLLKREAGTVMNNLQMESLSAKSLMHLVNFVTNEIAQTKLLLDAANKGVDSKGRPISLAEQAKIIKYSLLVLNLANQLTNFKNDYNYIENEDLKEEVKRVMDLLLEVTLSYSKADASGRIIHYSYEQYINETRKNLALKLLVQVNGNEFMAIGQHVHFKAWKLVRSSSKVGNISTFFDSPVSTSFVSRFIDSLADSPDIINLLVYDVVELKKHEANVKTLEVKDKLFALYQNLKGIPGISGTRAFYEVDALGHLTGNLISERNWGEWERNYKEDKKKFDELFWEAHKDENLFLSRDEMYNTSFYLTSLGAWRQGWHSQHSIKLEVKDDDGNPIKHSDGTTKKVWAPAIDSDEGLENKDFDYSNESWYELQRNPAAVAWLKEYMKLKKELDALLPDGSTNAFGVRAPLFMGVTTNRFNNVFRGDGKIKRIAGLSLRRFVTLSIAASPDDVEFGGEHDTYGSEELTDLDGVIFSRAHSNAMTAVDRVPMYGVKKLPNEDDLSTDLIQSTLAYASMAYSYNSLSEVADVVAQVAVARKEVSDESNTKKNISMRQIISGGTSYGRLADYVLQQVYNNYHDDYLDDVWNRTARKMFGKMARLGSVWMLGFNVHSALTNAFTGFNEIVKEAISGEEYTLGDFGWATAYFAGMWFVGFLQNVCNIPLKDGSIIESNTKLDLFLRMYNVQNENERTFRDWHIQTKGYGLTKGWSYTNIAMLPYSITDQWMQAIAFLSSARHTKLYNKDTGEHCSLWDAYTVKNTSNSNNRGLFGKVKDSITDTKKLVLRGNPEDWYIFDANLDTLNKALKKKEAELEAKGESLSTAEVNAIYLFEGVERPHPLAGTPGGPEEGTVIVQQERIIDPETGDYMLKDVYVPFDSVLLNRFRLRCRAINNRMHGVYNRGDGGAYDKLAISSVLASMKKYAIGLIDRRFSTSRYDYRIHGMRQGSTVTMANLLIDCFTAYSSGNTNGIIKYMDELKFSDGMYIFGTAGKLLYGIAKFLYISTLPSAHLGIDAYLRERGYSDNLIANIRRFWGDQVTPIIIKLMMSLIVPPDEDDDNEEGEEDPLFPGVSKAMELAYLKVLQNSIFGDLTIDDENILTEENFEDITYNRSGTVPFSVKGILYYQLYRGLLEQQAYNVTSLVSMFGEYKGLTDSSLPGLTAIYDIMFTIGMITENVTDEELDEMDEEDAEKYYNGKEIYLRGDNSDWYKWAKKVLKVTPTRTAETWFNGYASYESMKYFKSPWNKEKYEEGAFSLTF